jgi:polar amino acid transport system ATP-binding protein/putative ABC transport system ATP-binding protein
MLRINHLSLGYDGRTVLRDVNVHVRRGEVKCVGGESGSGKSSLIRAVMGFADCEGEILVDGIRLSAATVGQIRQRIAYVPQELALPHETVAEMVWMPFRFRANRHVAPSRERLLAEWERLGLDASLLEKRTTEISGGQRQRMMVAVAGLLEKPLIVADEPTSALDADSALLLRDYLLGLAAERGVAVCVVSHAPQFLSLPGTLILPSLS